MTSRSISRLLGLAAAAASLCLGAEARFGLSSPATVSFFTGRTTRGAELASRAGPAFRANIYPTLKLGSNWFGYAALQTHSEPYFYEELSGGNARCGVELSLLQAYVGYRVVRDGRSLTLRAGHLTSAFGSFPLRYDDARNWLIDLPPAYGYYYVPVSVYGMQGAEADITLGRIDARVQLTASSPSNPRGWRASDRYANWTLGGGITIRQGFRIGVSAVHGPYLHRQHRFFFPGESAPRRLPATGYGVDVQWARASGTSTPRRSAFSIPTTRYPTSFKPSATVR